MTKEQIKHMVDRFLGWRLPETFSPDGGIGFKKTFNDHLPIPMKHKPVGTNLFDVTQATEMVCHLIDGLPESQETAGWLIERIPVGTQPVWWGPPCSRWEWQQALVTPDLWTSDASKAVCFARKEDAEAVIRFEGFQHAIATDHMWS